MRSLERGSKRGIRKRKSDSKKAVGAYHEATQVGHAGNSKEFKFAARERIQEFTLKEDLCVAKSIRDNLEYGGLIYQTPDGKYDYTKAIKGTKDDVDPWEDRAPKIPRCARESGYWRTHGDHSDKYGNRTTKSKDYYDSNNFSDRADGSGDLPAARQGLSIHPDYRAYVGTPSAGYKGFRAATNHVYKL